MKGYNTKTRYQVKMMLAVTALALFYESSGWAVVTSAVAGVYMFLKGKKESVKNLWWMSLSAISFVVSLILTTSTYLHRVLPEKKGAESGFVVSVDKCHLVQQCLACTLVASIVSSVFSEKSEDWKDNDDSDNDNAESGAVEKKKKTTTNAPETTKKVAAEIASPPAATAKEEKLEKEEDETPDNNNNKQTEETPAAAVVVEGQ
eukprot:CAMPEP_0117011008 /NCGR_PEP_ID=MMETSP0472-20121206/9558_1 /TAXON_ID=693140 ORGANISM="Tiarina fusus, Strain LIS" /NCGR_SAMPLE_ID=MMETSP0472 /ASSEMBLY_ACC=CAM_ASM_000603 /LENGTH=203 /DNA_ID=CAMNT_0004713687 /DNA_START=209 /DNA_END=821 /DNA_ORIENTATION=-